MSESVDYFPEEPMFIYSDETKVVGPHIVRKMFSNPNKKFLVGTTRTRTDGFRCIVCENSWPYGSEKWAERTPCRSGVDPQDYRVVSHCGNPVGSPGRF